MMLQQDFLGIQDLEEISTGRSAELLLTLEELFSPDVELRHEALNQLCEVDAHRRSPLAASFLVYRLFEQDLTLRAKIVHAICDVIKGRDLFRRPPPKVREYLHHALRAIGEREVHSLLELIQKDHDFLDPVCLLLNQCSRAGEILVKVLNCSDYPIPIRTASCEVIGMIGFLEAEHVIETLEKRLSDRTIGQFSMAFAPRALEEAKEMIPILRRTLDALREASI